MDVISEGKKSYCPTSPLYFFYVKWTNSTSRFWLWPPSCCLQLPEVILNDLKHKMAAQVISFDEKPSCPYSIQGFLPKSNFFNLGRNNFVTKRLEFAHFWMFLFWIGWIVEYKEQQLRPSASSSQQIFLQIISLCESLVFKLWNQSKKVSAKFLQ